MSYQRMDHAEWMRSNNHAINRRRARQSKPPLPEEFTEFQTKVIDIVGMVGGGIYNAPICGPESIDWEYGGMTDPYFDLGGPLDTGVGSNSLGGYLQIQNDPNNPNQAGQAVFSNITITAVPEPASLSLLAIGSVGLFVRRRAKSSV